VVPNKLEHTVVGLSAAGVGWAGLAFGWLMPVGWPLFGAMLVGGAVWAAVIGHAGWYLAGLLYAPVYYLGEAMRKRRRMRLGRG